MKHSIEWFKSRAGKYVYRSSTVPIMKDTWYLLRIPFGKCKNYRTVNFEKEILRLFNSQTLYGLVYSDHLPKGKTLSTVVL